jgi:methylphosphotriester-DNA--protein-cysteine methyltransferase
VQPASVQNNSEAEENNFQIDKKEVVYVGSAHSNKYHYPWCQWAKKISPQNLVTFSSVADAKSKGYVACKVCNPPEKDK